MSILNKLKENVFAVLPVTLLVVILHFLVAPIDGLALTRFVVGGVVIIIGLSIFLLGVDITIQPVGQALGSSLVRKKNLILLMVVGFFVGFLINVAEPNLHVLSAQVQMVTGGLLPAFLILVVAAIGIGIMIAMGLLRTVLQWSIKNFLLIMYGAILVLCILAPTDFIGIAFDASGAATGSITVPFILALGLGVASVHGGKGGEEDSFGLTAAACGGPIIAVLLMAIFMGLEGIDPVDMSEEAGVIDTSVFGPFLSQVPVLAKEIFLAIAPVFVITLIAQVTLMKLPRRTFRRIMVGFIYTYIGFVLFLTGVNAGFMDAGRLLGEAVAAQPVWITVGVGALVGLVVILAEPSVHVLTAQVEDITAGALTRNAILITLALSAAASVALTVIRLVTGVPLWPFFLFGYGAALIISRFTPAMFVGLGFDSGGVASGPMTSTFILAFAQGVAVAVSGPLGLLDAFGVIAMVTVVPPITLQIFGIIYERQQKRLAGAHEEAHE